MEEITSYDFRELLGDQYLHGFTTEEKLAMGRVRHDGRTNDEIQQKIYEEQGRPCTKNQVELGRAVLIAS